MNKKLFFLHSVLFFLVMACGLNAAIEDDLANADSHASKILTQQIVLEDFKTIFQPIIVASGKKDDQWRALGNSFVAFVAKAATDVAEWNDPIVDVVSGAVTTRISLREYAIRLLTYVGADFSLAPSDVKNKAIQLTKDLNNYVPLQPVASVGENGLQALSSDQLIVSIKALKPPMSSADIDAALFLFTQAFESVRADVLKFPIVFDALKAYCAQAASIPDWSASYSGKALHGESPKVYLKSFLSNVILTLRNRYSAVSGDARSALSTFLSGPVFLEAVGLGKGKTGILRLSDGSCVSLSKAGGFVKKGFVSAYDPSMHFLVSNFNEASRELSLTASGKNIVNANGTFAISDSDASSSLRFVVALQGYSLVDVANKKLRFKEGISQQLVFGDDGVEVSFSLISDAQTVLDRLTGSLATDLAVFDAALQAVKSSPVDLDFVISLLKSYIEVMALRAEWITTINVDSKNPSASAKDYAVSILKKVRDAAWLFTGLTKAITDKIEGALRVAQDQTAFYSAQISALDGLAAAIKAPSDLVVSSGLILSLKTIVSGIMSAGTAEQRDLLLEKINSYYSSETIGALANNPSDFQKNDWFGVLFGYSASILSFDALSLPVWGNKMAQIKKYLISRLIDFDPSVQPQRMQVLVDSCMKKAADECARLSPTGPARQKMRQVLGFLSSQFKKISSDSNAPAQSVLGDSIEALWRNSKITAVSRLPVMVPSVVETPAVEVVKTVAPAPTPVVQQVFSVEV